MQIDIDGLVLRDILKTNRAKHNELFIEAIAGYRKAVRKELRRLLKVAEGVEKIETHLDLPDSKPVCHDEDYARAIAMVNLVGKDATISLDEEDFRQYVQDEWAWSHSFSSSSSSYSGSSASMSSSS